jgi:hypothetical protein
VRGTSFALLSGMSKHNNVNPSQYQNAGREPTNGPDAGENFEEQKQRFTQTEKNPKQGDRNFIPGAAPVGESEKKQ